MSKAMLCAALVFAAIPAAAETLRVGQVQQPGGAVQPGEPAQNSQVVLNLTAEEKHTVLENAEKELARASVPAEGVQEGHQVPQQAKPVKFNDIVVAKVPKLRAYTYFMVDEKVAIVDPKGALIAAVIEPPERK